MTIILLLDFKMFLAKTMVYILPKLRVGKLEEQHLSSDPERVK